MISRKLLLANAPSNIGEQIHINHVGCSAGEDHKKRLYIKRSATGIVGYCHHCSEHGFTGDSSSRLSTWLHSKPEIATNDRTPPVLAPLSVAGRVWLCNHYCDLKSFNFSGVSLKTQDVALALHNPDQEVIGWQVRTVFPKAYRTNFFDDTDTGEASWFHHKSNTLFITEDYLSAHRIHQDTGYSSVALLRTTITDKTLLQILSLEFKQVVVWLDPDDAGRHGALKVLVKLQYFLPCSVPVSKLDMDKEPKQCTPGELKSLLT